MTETLTKILDETVFHEAQAFMNSKFLKVIGYYFEDTEAYMQIILKGASEKDVSIIVPAAHTIKSSSKQLGADKLSLSAAELEEAARLCLKGEQSVDYVVSLVNAIQPVFAETMAKIKTMLSEQK